MLNIPQEFRDTPEATRLREADLQFEAACQAEREHLDQDGTKIHLISDKLRHALTELKQAQAAFDAATGEPKRVGLTPAVIEKISERFPADQQQVVMDALDASCGRTLPLMREAPKERLEFIRLAVLELSNGDLTELRKAIAWAQIDWRDVVTAARSKA
jgi:hypothetical protein